MPTQPDDSEGFRAWLDEIGPDEPIEIIRAPKREPAREVEVADSEQRAVAALAGYLEWAAGRLGAPFAGDPATPARLLVTALVDAAEARMSAALVEVAAEIIGDRPTHYI